MEYHVSQTRGGDSIVEVWPEDFPLCVASAPTFDEALTTLYGILPKYLELMEAAGEDIPLPPEPHDFVVNHKVRVSFGYYEYVTIFQDSNLLATR